MAVKAALVALFVAAPLMLSTGTAMAASGVNCNGVFPGKTPHVISKVADKTEAYAGQTVTFTIGFHSTGVSTADVRDCYRVDDGTDGTLNGLVTGFNAEIIHTNAGPKGTAQTVTFTITIPSDTSLIGHAIVDRAKITHGSKESKSEVVSVSIIAPPVVGCEAQDCTPPPTEICGNGIDDNNNGQIDEGCPVTPPHEICGNGIDDNNNGQIDENCDTGGTTPPGVTPAPKPKPKPKVKGVQLAHTGPATTAAAMLGSMMLMIGLATRAKRVRPATSASEVPDSAGSSYLVRYSAFLQAAQRQNAAIWRKQNR